MIKLIILSMGYVESITTARLIFCAKTKKPKTKLEAIHSLAEYLYRKFRIDNNLDIEEFSKQCCQDNFGKASYCPKCGQRLEHEEFDWELWKEFLFELHGSNCDSFGSREAPNPNGWDAEDINFSFEKDQYIDICSQGEDVLSIALSEIHPELVEDIVEVAHEETISDYRKLFCNKKTRSCK